MYSGILREEKCLRTVATGAFSNLEFANVKILISDIEKMFFAQVSMEYRIVLIGCRHYVMHTECAVAETHMLRCGDIALTPTTGDCGGNIHRGY